MSTIQMDFDKLASLDAEGWTHNNHYHKFLLSHVPNDCRTALEIGCGTGAFARLLAGCAQRVVAIDLSPEMIRVARARSTSQENIEFQVADITTWDSPSDEFDCVVAIATLHHVPLTPVLEKIKASLRAGGVLIVLDLFETVRLVDAFPNLVAMVFSTALRLAYNGRLTEPSEVQAAWAAHGQHDSYPKLRDIRELTFTILPDAKLSRHLFWRYSLIWTKPQ